MSCRGRPPAAGSLLCIYGSEIFSGGKPCFVEWLAGACRRIE